ncbi:MAG TPA: NAD(P)/FAD-dependent oxidoreductase, partial [Clostridiaceae bacterium]|nr:NAD(P)/FAD-dependent oxidoreductase [Clostridiaceae bacterium]
QEGLRKLEPGISEEAVGALFAPSAGIVGPWEFCIALAESAVVNGVTLHLDTEVIGITRMQDRFLIGTSNPKHRTIEARTVVNAAGVHADEVMAMAGAKEYEIHPRKGQYFILDKNQGGLVSHIIFQCPSALGKGVVVTPTVHGNLLVGPDSETGIPKEDTGTTRESLELIRISSEKSVKGISFRENIRNFAGIRAYSDCEDFIIEASQAVKGLVSLAGIKSPGLTSAPAIAEDVVEILSGMGILMEKKEDFISGRRQTRFMELAYDGKRALIEKDRRFGRVICRCESITEGEIVEAIRRPVGAVSVDGVKRRVRPGMGRCQGGFCGPRVQEILATELGTTLEAIEQDTKGSYILIGETKGGGERHGL